MSKTMNVTNRVYALAKMRAVADDRTLTEALDRIVFPNPSPSKPIHISASTYERLREIAYRDGRTIIDVIDELLTNDRANR